MRLKIVEYTLWGRHTENTGVMNVEVEEIQWHSQGEPWSFPSEYQYAWGSIMIITSLLHIVRFVCLFLYMTLICTKDMVQLYATKTKFF